MTKNIFAEATGEIEEKKSRFIAHLMPVTCEEEAVAYINSMKKKYFDARHNCYAFVIGDNSELTRCSDDGEPSGTAGRPILEVLLGEGLTNVVCVVTRYFGGTLLGTGGLVRAYQASTKEGINNSVIIEKKPGITCTIKADYTDVGKLQYSFNDEGVHTVDSIYGADVTFELVIDEDFYEARTKDFTEKTAGRAQIEKGDKVLYAEINGKIQIDPVK